MENDLWMSEWICCLDVFTSSSKQKPHTEKTSKSSGFNYDSMAISERLLWNGINREIKQHKLITESGRVPNFPTRFFKWYFGDGSINSPIAEFTQSTMQHSVGIQIKFDQTVFFIKR